MAEVAQKHQQTMMACAGAVEQNNLPLAEDLAKQIKYLAVSQEPAIRKVATYFAEALAQRDHGVFPQHSVSDSLQNNFYGAPCIENQIP